MRQQPSDTRKKPSKFCKFLLLLVGFKICLLAVVLVEPFVSIPSFLPSAQGLHGVSAKKTQPAAVAAASTEAANTTQARPVAGGVVAPAVASAPSTAVAPAQAQPRAASGMAFAATTAAPAAQQAPAAPNSLTLEALNRKQEELARREQDLRALEKELDARLVQLQGLEIRLQTMLKDAEETKGEKYKHLVDVLSNMKSRQAAEVLETLDEKIAVRVLAGMRGRQAGEILTYASPQKAARLTEALARMQMPLE